MSLILNANARIAIVHPRACVFPPRLGVPCAPTCALVELERLSVAKFRELFPFHSDPSCNSVTVNEARVIAIATFLRQVP